MKDNCIYIKLNFQYADIESQVDSSSIYNTMFTINILTILQNDNIS